MRTSTARRDENAEGTSIGGTTVSWKDPFEQQWPDPVDDLRQRFGIDLPSFTRREVAIFTGMLLTTLSLVVLVLELLL